MSRIFDNDELDDIYQSDYKFKLDNEVGAAISAYFIANVEEVYAVKCKEDDMTITLLEIVQAGFKGC